MASRRKGRILAFQALYSWDIHYSQSGDRSIPEDLLDFSWVENDANEKLDDALLSFSRLLIKGTTENINEIDRTIQDHLDNWEISRLNRVDLAVLRMSAYTLMYQGDMPPSIVIDEAVEISREYGTDDSYRFINGVLDGIRKSLNGTASSEPAGNLQNENSVRLPK